MTKSLLKTLGLTPESLERYPAPSLPKGPKVRSKPKPRAKSKPRPKGPPIPAFHALILSTYREQHNLSQSQLAAILGVCQQTISKMLKGKARLKDSHLSNLHFFSTLYRNVPFADFLATITAKKLSE